MKMNPQDSQALRESENAAFHAKAETALRRLFNAAKEKNELHFAMSLYPEFRGTQGPGWSTAVEAKTAFAEYLAFLKEEPSSTPLKARVALAFYSHLAEASGFYEIPKNMLRVAGGEAHNCFPFVSLVQTHKITGDKIAPNANKILKDLVGHSTVLGFMDSAEVFRDAFDPDLRNGYAHADYVVWDDGIRLPRHNGGTPKIVSWPEFNARLNRAINFFQLLRNIVREHITMYDPARQVVGRLGAAPETLWTISAKRELGILTISSK